MAKIECTIDTTKKTVEAKIDGKKIEPFGSMVCYGENSPMGFMCSVHSSEEMDDMEKHTTYMSVGEIEEFLETL